MAKRKFTSEDRERAILSVKSVQEKGFITDKQFATLVRKIPKISK